MVSSAVGRLMTIYPGVQMHLGSTNRQVDLPVEVFYVMLSAHSPLLKHHVLVTEILWHCSLRLFCHPAIISSLANRVGIDERQGLPNLDMGPQILHITGGFVRSTVIGVSTLLTPTLRVHCKSLTQAALGV